MHTAEHTMLTVRTILHPTDFSEHSKLAFRLARSLARDYGARLIVLHVAEPPPGAVGERVFTLPPPLDLEALRQRLQKLKPRDPKIPVEHRVVEGLADTEILKAAEATKCDVIVLGTHGRTGLDRLLMGSVAEQVLRGAPCPVVTVKTPLPATGSYEGSTPESVGRVS
jgi:nucleotide-binding universal stress UspA family protein